jgi:hypothetical protein
VGTQKGSSRFQRDSPLSERYVTSVRCAEDVPGALQMTRTEDYRRYARECMELSRLVNTEKTRTILSHMAQVWLRLADQKNDPGAESPRQFGSPQPE